VPDARNVDGEVSRVLAEAQEAGLVPEVATGFHLLSFRHHQDGNYAAAHDETLRAAEASRTGRPRHRRARARQHRPLPSL
jgi:hypothetical protein